MPRNWRRPSCQWSRRWCSAVARCCIHDGFRYALTPRRGGRAPELEALDQLQWLGRLIARMHAIGARQPFAHRGRLDHDTMVRQPVQAALESTLLPASLQTNYRTGTVHSLGGDVVVFEIQQNSDVTFRLYDWNHVDAKTGQPRVLQVDKAIACIDFSEGPVCQATPVVESSTPVEREKLFDCEYFRLWRLRGQSPSRRGGTSAHDRMHRGCRRVGALNVRFAFAKGDVFLLPAAIGQCIVRPSNVVNLLDIALPD